MDVVYSKILATGAAFPESVFSQKEVLEFVGATSAKARRFFEHPHIKNRHLSLPDNVTRSQNKQPESTEELLSRFKTCALSLGQTAVTSALQKLSLTIEQIDFVCCVTSTGFIVPGLSTYFINEMGFRKDCRRLDVVGMGCNAGLNGLNAVASWCAAHPQKKALLICCEICSAIYSMDGSEQSALVNSLFGDGVTAAVLSCDSTVDAPLTAQLIDFETYLIPNSEKSLRFDWSEQNRRFRFVVEKNTPEQLAAHIETPIGALLSRHDLTIKNLTHWVLHTGGAAILDGIEKRLNLKPDALRHTRSVLKDYGNISSGSFLLSFSRLMAEGLVRSGDLGLMATMGPGLTIEMALVRWL